MHTNPTTNRLASETSPYLLQHAHNPVDWYPWGAEALGRARAEGRPILLSIGYAACHWCHVMAHESFEDEATARLMNDLFVNIKVDREERPDIDSIYMQAVQAMTGQGGWPMTVFLTPDGVPFYGGTYFPPTDRHGIPSFQRILTSIAAAWRDQPERIAETVGAMSKLYHDAANQDLAGGAQIGSGTLDIAFRGLARRYDETFAGFDGAPKFPPTMALEFLLRHWRRTGNEDALRMAHTTFIRMARGGIYDQIGGGFARYSVDARWMVPHFEKMLYDNALLIKLGAHLYQATRDAEVRRVTEETITWATREMMSPEGGFYSSLDADSEGHEGTFYIWSIDEFRAVLGEDARIAELYFGVTEGGNFEGRNILTVAAPPAQTAARLVMSEEELLLRLADIRKRLYDRRESRERPGRDDKILASWNGLMVQAIAAASFAFDDAKLADVAERCANFLLEHLVVDANGLSGSRVKRTFSRGQARIAGYLEDHAAVGLAFVSMYEITFNTQWLERAQQLGAGIVGRFSNVGAAGGASHGDASSAAGKDAAGDAVRDAAAHSDAGFTLFDTADDGEVLIARPRDMTDNAMPSGNSLATQFMLALGEHLGDEGLKERAATVASSVSEGMARYPTAFGNMLCCADDIVNGTVQVAIVGESNAVREMKKVVAGVYLPGLTLAGHGDAAPPSTDTTLPLLVGREAPDGEAVAFICRGYVCEEPARSTDQLAQQLNAVVAGMRK